MGVISLKMVQFSSHTGHSEKSVHLRMLAKHEAKHHKSATSGHSGLWTVGQKRVCQIFKRWFIS